MAGTGSARPGAGRKKGGTNREKADLQAALAANADLLKNGGTLSAQQLDNMSPVDVMLFAMKRELLAGNLGMAAQIAEKAAPYFHAKLAPKMAENEDQTIQVKIIGGLPK